MNLNLEREVAIVTGTARGIGRAIALTFAREGSNIIIDDIDLGAAELVEEEAKTLGAQVIVVRADVTKPGEVRRMVSETLSKFGRLDILVNNAGILYTDFIAMLVMLGIWSWGNSTQRVITFLVLLGMTEGRSYHCLRHI